MNLVEIEERIIKFWEAKKIFEKTLAKNKGGHSFVFYEGPPSANGAPGLHHILTRVFKDIILRYKTMRGFNANRKAGWDTHGLPVELQVEKELGLKNKKDIEKYGIAEFNKKCKETVWRYKEEWEKLTKRIAFWLDLKNPYITYENDYIESLWWIIRQIWDKKLLYQDYKVVPYCPRCGTTLSSHEVAQGYKTVKENSIYVKFPAGKLKNTYLLVWTTTPWTLPANIVLAVNQRINYVKVKQGSEYLILAEKRLGVLDGKYKIINKSIGRDINKLVNLKYPIKYPQLLPYLNSHSHKNFNVVFGDFVSDKDGTGIVHIAPAYGEEDMNLAKKLDLEEFLMCIDKEGKFEAGFPWSGKFVKDADKDIIQELKNRKLLYKDELYEHEYPFCWRCDTPLIYYAKNSWFIKMSALRKQLLQNNKKINWVPGHFKYGRFGDWLKEVKDWAFSRERYWGTPLPIWKCENGCPPIVVGSIKELGLNSNTFYFSRHGEAKNNVLGMLSSYPEKEIYDMTEAGLKQTEKIIKRIKNKGGIDLIFSSDLLRTKHTAEIIGKELNVPVAIDERLREYNLGEYNGRPEKEFDAVFPENNKDIRWTKAPKGGETWTQIQGRMIDFIKENDKKYKNKRILIISHGDPLWLVQKYYGSEREYPNFAELFEINVSINDLHRPYIDEVEFPCPCGEKMKRVPDVIDVWFDSGAMPFAQWHYPFENKEKIGKGYAFPADFISEAVDQTRGWFYTLLAVSTLLNKGPAYKNVICLGHILDTKGQKMSKSKGNIIMPEEIINKYGADPVRWYLYTINEEGEGKCFNSKELEDKQKRFFGTILNSLVFFTTYVDKSFKPAQIFKPKNLLDKWIISKLNLLISGVIKNLDKYSVVNAARLFEDFVDDLSNWYIRRSRRRFQNSENEREKEGADQALYYTLINLTKLLAPFIPFISEEIYQKLTINYRIPNTNRKESVHLEDYPNPNKKLIDKKLIKEMAEIRRLASLALAKRAEASIRVRQPLASFKIKNQKSKIKNNEELLKVLADEINVKSIIFDSEIKYEVELNTEITPELREQGILRDFVRLVQGLRQKAGYQPKDKICLFIEMHDDLQKIINQNLKEFKSEIGAGNIKFEKVENPDAEEETKIDNQKIWVGIKKI